MSLGGGSFASRGLGCIGLERDHPSLGIGLLGDVALAPGCTSPTIDVDADTPRPSAAPGGVTLVLAATRASDGCCRILTMNPGRADVAVFCTLVAVNPSGRIVYSGWIPGPPPGRTRPSGFVAPPGRHGYGVLKLPIDLVRDSYTAPCRPAAWHGGAPI
jgi:hypothetical protein